MLAWLMVAVEVTIFECVAPAASVNVEDAIFFASTREFDEGITTGSLGEIMRQVVEEDVQSCSEHLIGDSNPTGE